MAVNTHRRYKFEKIILRDSHLLLHEGIDRTSTRKVLIQELRYPSPEVLLDLKQSTQLISTVCHENLPTMTDFFSDRKALFLVFRFFRGKSLDQYFDQPRADGVKVHVFLQLVSAIQKIHELGFLHGMLNPRCVWVEESGRLKILQLALFPDPSTITHLPAGGLPSYPGYCSSDHIEKGSFGVEIDLYALGAILCICFRSDLSLPPDLSASNLPVELRTIAIQCFTSRNEGGFWTTEQLAERFFDSQRVFDGPAHYEEWCKFPNKDPRDVAETIRAREDFAQPLPGEPAATKQFQEDSKQDKIYLPELKADVGFRPRPGEEEAGLSQASVVDHEESREAPSQAEETGTFSNLTLSPSLSRFLAGFLSLVVLTLGFNIYQGSFNEAETKVLNQVATLTKASVKIQHLQGDVFWKKHVLDPWQPVTPGAVLPQGSSLRTGRDSFVVVGSKESGWRIKLGRETEIDNFQFETDTSGMTDSVRFQCSEGEMHFDFRQSLALLTVELGWGILNSRAGALSVKNKNISTIRVYAGAIKITPRKEPPILSYPGKQLRLKEGRLLERSLIPENFEQIWTQEGLSSDS